MMSRGRSRRYRRQDEIGTPYGITVDSETLTTHTVTVRERDSMGQERVSIERLVEKLQDLFRLRARAVTGAGGDRSAH